MKVYKSLRYGKENAIPSKVLAQALGFQTVRELQKQVDRCSKELRELDEAIQQTNWTVELMETT